MTIWKWIRSICLCAVFLTTTAYAPSSFAGSGPSVGVIKAKVSPADALLAKLLARHRLGHEYGWNNAEFQSLLNKLMRDSLLDQALGDSIVAKDAIEIFKTLEREFQRINYISKNGVDLDATNKAIRTLLETFVKVNTPPGSSYPLAVLKLSVAYRAGYVYGFFWGV